MPSKSRGTPEHSVWRGIKKRCYSPRARGYANYGGRGIKVCDRWRESFAAFYADMGPRPSPDHQIDRYPDGNGDYEPGNCRWATRAEQNRNRKNNRLLLFRGHIMCLTDWAKRVGMSKGTLLERLQRGMSIEEALTTPVRRWRTDDEFRLTPVEQRDAEWHRDNARRQLAAD